MHPGNAREKPLASLDGRRDLPSSQENHDECHLHCRARTHSVEQKQDHRPKNTAQNMTFYGTHSNRCSKASMVYKKTKNMRAVQIFLVQTKMDITVRYPGSKVDDSLDLAEQLDI